MKKIAVRLTRKLADAIDGVDLSDHAVGETFRVAVDDARLLVAEEWAVPVEQRTHRSASHRGPERRTVEGWDEV